MTVDLGGALFLDFVVEVAFMCSLWSTPDGFCSTIFPLSMACSESVKKERTSTATGYPVFSVILPEFQQ